MLKIFYLNVIYYVLQFLLSSSVDNTVRLWQVGCDRCLRVFCHNNYGESFALIIISPFFFFGCCFGLVRIANLLIVEVDVVTCVDFNPLDDNYFISGSIDGKVRIWEVRRCRVVDYIDIREIVTAVSYRPDGKV